MSEHEGQWHAAYDPDTDTYWMVHVVRTEQISRERYLSIVDGSDVPG